LPNDQDSDEGDPDDEQKTDFLNEQTQDLPSIPHHRRMEDPDDESYLPDYEVYEYEEY
jgi:hypothetical protein